jgi:hypothetical protein
MTSLPELSTGGKVVRKALKSLNYRSDESFGISEE